eukprot:7621947-Alexandrium_andersonii.AAC.1
MDGAAPPAQAATRAARPTRSARGAPTRPCPAGGRTRRRQAQWPRRAMGPAQTARARPREPPPVAAPDPQAQRPTARQT